ncbi:MAG TPA: D-sedoheptulose 7-phosphate isomerase [Cyclobacteriaceae bacterium]|nr:D-sedoheptulose 7-phosphate isomerase [Cyclobacteriaceae bacterium]MCB9238455.1 D-sedoheptulose 7-phosphate isomerase [Flammeovirgaceae bacterium]MCB0500874.1 D-sedoheptulose 7-phosphate isomerase [Cyclobacteriaceae bacterium]MCO5271250.1 D-sedoheptulose 7-phosphate isomerase [Cyclobacteriaceae bacterium]MCW5903852.1 D-sedoheptulose 7-phosphate isomerase [Cyclobacteriaceae bacterium]
MDVRKTIREELSQAALTLNNFLQSESALKGIEEAAAAMATAIQAGHKVISCGNGGSHCDAMHFAEELSGRFRADRRALPAISISDPAHITCVGNDYGFEFVFSRYVEALGKRGDVLLAISTSGNSPNVLRATEAARERGMKVIALCGKDGGKLAGMADVGITVPHHGFADRIQEVHIKIIHILILLIEKQVK